MVSRTWLGGGNNKASNPKDWSPTGAPRNGDTLTMNGGTINIQGNDLASPGIGALTVSGDTTINLSNATMGSPIRESRPIFGPPANSTINVHGTSKAYFDLFAYPFGGGSATINLVGNSRWFGGFGMLEGGITVNGPADKLSFFNVPAQVSFSGHGPANVSVVQGGTAIINANVGGKGGFEIERVKGLTGKLEFGRSVGAEQTVTLDSGNDGQVQIDHPKEFFGAVNVAGDGDIDLIGLVKADSYSYHNDMLSIFGAGRVLDTLRLTSASAFNVEKTSVGVSIYTAHDFNHPTGTLLPIHT